MSLARIQTSCNSFGPPSLPPPGVGLQAPDGECRADRSTFLTVFSIEIISSGFKRIHRVFNVAAAAAKKLTFLARGSGSSLSAGPRRIAAIEVSNPVVSPFCIAVLVKDTHSHSQRSKAFVFHVKISLLHLQSKFPSMRGHCWFISDINVSILNWTYHAFDKPKIIVMCNGYDILGC